MKVQDSMTIHCIDVGVALNGKTPKPIYIRIAPSTQRICPIILSSLKGNLCGLLQFNISELLCARKVVFVDSSFSAIPFYGKKSW